MTIDQLTALITAVAADELPIWDADEAKTKKITVQDFINSVVTIAGLLKQTDVVDNLTSTSTTAPLSAAQGKALNTIEDNQITKVGDYINERANFKARRVGTTVIILSYVQVKTEVPATTQFADIGFSNAEGMFLFADSNSVHVVNCTTGKLKPDVALPTGYYYAIGTALAPIQ